MGLARVYRKPSMQQVDRLPVSSYEEAVQRLTYIRLDEDVTDAAYFLAVSIIADIFWVNDQKVIRDVTISARQIELASTPARRFK